MHQARSPTTGAGYAQRAVKELSRVGIIQAIPAVLEEFGVDPSQLFSRLDVAPALFANPDHLIATSDGGRLLRLGAELTGCPHFGLLLGQRAGLESLGFLGTLARHAPDVGTGLRAINNFLGLSNGAAVATLSEHGALAMWSYAVHEPGLDGTEQIYQCASGIAYDTLRRLCGPEWSPQEVWFPCRRPRDPQPFRRLYRAPVRFDADHLSVTFARSWLDRPISGADTALHLTLLQQAMMLEARIAAALPGLVRRVLRRMMLAGRGSIEEVAAAFSVHRRTLDRHLDADGVTFRSLAEEVRFAVAQQLLRDTDLSISEIAAALHYANPSAFATAFRRWSGMTASQWRAKEAA